MRSFDRGGRGTAALALTYLGRFYCNRCPGGNAPKRENFSRLDGLDHLQR